jgi:hypothetical protein
MGHGPTERFARIALRRGGPCKAAALAEFAAAPHTWRSGPHHVVAESVAADLCTVRGSATIRGSAA